MDSYEGFKIEAITSQLGLQQIIKEPTHFIGNFSSCIDLIFILQSNLVLESVFHFSLHPNRHHQLVFGKFNLKIAYPSLYGREIWHYEKVNTDHTQNQLVVSLGKGHLLMQMQKKVYIFIKT